MKMQIVGFEINEGTSSKTGKAYAIGRLHTMIPLSGSAGAKGYIGHTYDAEVSILRKIEHLAPPFAGEVEVQQVSMYGKPINQVVSVVPTERAKPS